MRTQIHIRHERDTQDAAERLKHNLQMAVDTLRHQESPRLVQHIVHDVAHLASVYGERRLRQQFEDIIKLAEANSQTNTREPLNSASTLHGEQPYTTTRSDCTRNQYDTTHPSTNSWSRESEQLHNANRDLLSKMKTMKHAVRNMEAKRTDEHQHLTLEVDRYKELLSETEQKLINERIINHKLRKKLDELSLPSSRQTSRQNHYNTSSSNSSRESLSSAGKYGFGALTVRQCDCSSLPPPSRESNCARHARPLSAKSRKHRHE